MYISQIFMVLFSPKGKEIVSRRTFYHLLRKMLPVVFTELTHIHILGAKWN